jgi:hypothetical protein
MWFLQDSDLDPVRDNPRYPSLLNAFKARHPRMETPGAPNSLAN